MEPERPRLEKLLRTDLERLKVIQEQVPRSAKGQNWHREHTDRIKRRVDETARRLDK